jgi:hypothetical protein
MATPTVLKPTPVRPVPPALNSREYTPPETTPPKQTPKWRTAFAAVIPWLLAVLLTIVILQIALGAAMALGGDFDYLNAHGMLAGVLHLVPLLLLIVGLLAKDWPAAGAGAAVLVLVTLQYPLIEMTGALRGMHVLNALLIFTITLLTMHERMPWVKRVKPVKAAKPAKPAKS